MQVEFSENGASKELRLQSAPSSGCQAGFYYDSVLVFKGTVELEGGRGGNGAC